MSRVKEIGWSISKARTFLACPRRYYYHYYYACQPVYGDDPEIQRAADMRRIKGLDMWAGEVVHSVIEWVLTRTQEHAVPSDGEARAETLRLLSQGWKGSKLALWRKEPNTYPNLFEHYYDVEMDKSVTDRIKDKAVTSVANFMDSDILRSITRTPDRAWLPFEKYMSFRLDGLLFYIKYDFALRDGDRLTVYDWKTGKPTEDEGIQLACYAMYAAERYGVPLENTRVVAVHLQPTLEAHEGAASVDSVVAFARESYSAMLDCLRDPIDIEGFAPTDDPIHCLYCPYKGICAQGSVDIESMPVVDDWLR